MAGTFQCSVVTPERTVIECEARFVALPAHDGEMGILRNRAPLVVKLDVGVLRIETGEDTEVFFIDGGFAEMVHNRLTVLTEQAVRTDDLAADDARALLEEARAMPHGTGDDGAFESRRRAVKGARLRKKLSRS